ncbi:Fe-S cluster assembly protein SufD [Aliiglaciecola sp. CAU 1673]|uniref:Fe-S cluster assembly protein SufD n=1 Tax=Aliiglaciecola sp. CAU 1673 TaxID=3032595 RepID=UPI0023DBCE68|nr:Fe-S cluster assembly protein SufD [Aliiglaciecola sp. CAU 1673]MDF2178926.1 Fe-S cluster assembly protein SufD [Aliiglaciecola sp. CAU 1673]
MSQWLEQVIERAEKVSDHLSAKRGEALSLLRQQRWPNRRVEAWKYTSLTPIEQLTLVEGATNQKIADIPAIPGVNSLDLVFCGGRLVTDLSGLSLPKGLNILPLSQAQQQTLSLFASIKPKQHLFGLVNDVLAIDGLLLDIEAGADITQPIRIVYLSQKDSESHNRLLVRVGEGAKVCVIEHALGAQSSLATEFAEYKIEKNAQLEHYRLNLRSGKALDVGGNHFFLDEKAQLNSSLVAFGSDLSRLDVDIVHGGEHANAKFNAIYLLGTGETFDLHSCVEHAVAHGTTEENARGIIGDRAKAVFNGRIHIHRHAQKTLAELNNRNLLLSRRGQVNTKPELEIYADDVKCAHGATVAEIEEKALYYLRSRGISRSQALVMLNYGFIQELIDELPNQALADWLAPMLRSRFEQMEVK